eukprot:gene3420-1785_t
MLLVDQISGGHSHGPSESNNDRRTSKSVATIGLVVHAAADGVALGAAATTSRSDVEMIVFIAIMLHKAPAAFGLTTFLLTENVERNRIRRHLLVFSLAAPIAALVIFYGLSQGSKEVLSNMNGTGIAMLFSAGTFFRTRFANELKQASVSFLAQVLINRHDSNKRGILKTAGFLKGMDSEKGWILKRAKF